MQARPRATKRILVGTDFSRPATGAVVRAAMLAAEHVARLEIVHVAARLDRARLRRLGVGGALGAAAAERIEEQLARARALALAQGVTAAVKLLRGSAPTMLAREAARSSADLVVLGGRGEHTLRDALVGTTAERVAERWTGDTLIVRGAARAPYGAILACVALAPASGAVVMSAAALSARARLHVLHAYEAPFEGTLLAHHVDGATLTRHRAAAAGEAVRGLTELVRRCPVPSERHLERHVRHGEPAAVIAGIAARYGVDVVVVGKNQSRLEEFFLGSVTRQILRAVRTDVLVSEAR